MIPKPQAGRHVRLYLITRRPLDGIIGEDRDDGCVEFTRDRTGETLLVPWDFVMTYHALDDNGWLVPKQPLLPLEVGR